MLLVVGLFLGICLFIMVWEEGGLLIALFLLLVIVGIILI